MDLATRKKMISYSAFAAVWNISAIAQSEVQYVDFDPDIVLDEPNENFNFDADNDGEFDFVFDNFSFTIVTSSTWPYSFYNKWYRQDLLVQNFESENAMIGNTNFVDTYYYGFNRYYPAALFTHALITPEKNWMDHENQLLVLRDMDELGSAGYFQAGNWYPEQYDKYLGFRFVREDGNHYGWMRCDVTDNGRALILKDYAYEEFPDKGMFAGSTRPIDQPDSTFTSYVYTFNGVIHISFNFQFTNPVQLNIYNTAGQSVYEQELTNAHTTITTEIPDGVYVLHFFSDDINETREIAIHR